MMIINNNQLNQIVTNSCVTPVIPVIPTPENIIKKDSKNKEITNYSIARNFYLTDNTIDLEKNYGSYGKLRHAVIFLHRLSAVLRGGLYIFSERKYISPEPPNVSSVTRDMA